MTEGNASHTLDEASCSSAQGSLQGAADTSMAAVLRTALARLQLDAAQTDRASGSGSPPSSSGNGTQVIPGEGRSWSWFCKDQRQDPVLTCARPWVEVDQRPAR
ncbi:unnamed protein product [Gadus morhua 'NCC']